MKELLKQRKCTIYRIQKDLGFGSMRLRRLLDGTTKRIDYKMICDMACYLKIEVNRLYEMILWERNK